MTPQEFKENYIKESGHTTIAGIVGMTIGFGGCIVLLALDISLYGAIALGAFGCIAAYGFYLTSLHKKAIADGSNPLLKGIENGNSDYVKWCYTSVLTYKNRRPPFNKLYSVNVYNDKKLYYLMSLESEEECNAVMDLISNKFPKAQMGYSEEIRKSMKDQYKYKNISQPYKESDEK